MNVIKRDGTMVAFDNKKIVEAITKAMKYGSGFVDEKVAMSIALEIQKQIEDHKDKTLTPTIHYIETEVYLKLIEHGHEMTAKSYEEYRAIQSFKRENNTTDDSILGLINMTNKEVMNENSNKDAVIASTQRDLIAGEVSKDIARRKLLPAHVVQAHDTGVLHYHDQDYGMQKIFNCFGSDTSFISDRGTVKFSDLEEGELLTVPTHTGEWKNAVVNSYGEQELFELTFTNCRSTKTVRATRNHRWLLDNGEVTTNIQVGAKLMRTPDCEPFNFNDATFEQMRLWCIGFAIGDGTLYRDGTYIRLCDKKIRFEHYFKKAGFNVTYPKSYKGDVYVSMPSIYKDEFIRDYKKYDISKDDAKYLIMGLLNADGNLVVGENDLYRGICTSNDEVHEMIMSFVELTGYYVGSVRKENNTATNYSESRNLTWIGLNKGAKRVPWKLEKIEPLNTKEKVWCLEVEDNHSFILSGGLVTGNCCLVNMGDMLDNGTVINKRMIESPKTFQVACTVMTQIIAQIASSQYGGQSVDVKHLGKYLRRSKERYYEMFRDMGFTGIELEEVVERLTEKELVAGIQTIQYQINTLQTSNGQSPFLTLFLNIDEEYEYVEEVALIVKEILKQRLQGIKNEKGIYTTPAFPKLIYVLHEHNCLEGGEYDHVTELAVKCSAKRLYPDYISSKEMRKIYEGNVFSPMGCRSFLSPWKDENGEYKFEGRFNMGK